MASLHNFMVTIPLKYFTQWGGVSSLVVLNLWVMAPLQIACQIFYISDIYIPIHSSSKISD